MAGRADGCRLLVRSRWARARGSARVARAVEVEGPAVQRDPPGEWTGDGGGIVLA